MPVLLKVKNLRVEFNLNNDIFTAVKDVSLEIAEKETVVLAGESGSGKSITALSLTKILPKNARIVSGEVFFRGQDLIKIDQRMLVKIRGKEIAYIFQEPTSYLNPVYTIGDQIMEAIMLHQEKSRFEARAETLNLLSQVKIADPERVILDYPHQLSGGMNQRAFIAMCLACSPKILIADEPTTSLDVTIESAVLELLKGLQQKFGFSLLFITHNLSIAKKIADKICIMYQGKVVEAGNAGDIFDRPKHPHTKELISAYQQIGKL